VEFIFRHKFNFYFAGTKDWGRFCAPPGINGLSASLLYWAPEL